MATRPELPADFAAALDQYPAARERFGAMPVERQNEWLNWIARGRGRGGRRRRIDEAVRRLSPSATAAAAQEEVAGPVGPPPDRTWWIWLLLLLLLVIGGLLAWFLTRGPGKTTVPRVVGLPVNAAVQRLHQRHLKDHGVPGPSNRPAGVVFAQAPGAGVQVDKNKTVTISVSTGPVRKAVPDVVGDPVATASSTLRQKGFVPVVQHHASAKPKGIVFAQQPLAGVTAVKGTKVIISVSTGVKPVTVPRVVNEPQGTAVNTLTRVGLKPVLKNVPSTKPVGQVVAQKPAAGTKVDKGSAVTLNVSSGTGGTTTTVNTTTTTATTSTVTTSTSASAPTTRRVTVPSVRGLAVATGVRRLNGAGLRPIVRYVASTQRAGLIVSQAPASGTARTGSPVRIAVSEGPNPATPATVPNVIGQDQSTATTTLRQAGFKVLVLFRKTTNSSQDGLVIDEQPKAGSSIPTGSYVAIFVGRFTG